MNIYNLCIKSILVITYFFGTIKYNIFYIIHSISKFQKNPNQIKKNRIVFLFLFKLLNNSTSILIEINNNIIKF